MPTTTNSSTRLLLSEVLRKVSNAKTKQEKINLLRKHNSTALRQLCLLYTSPSPRDKRQSRMPSSA